MLEKCDHILLSRVLFAQDVYEVRLYQNLHPEKKYHNFTLSHLLPGLPI